MFRAILILVIVAAIFSHFYEAHNTAMRECLNSHSVDTCEHTLNR